MNTLLIIGIIIFLLFLLLITGLLIWYFGFYKSSNEGGGAGGGGTNNTAPGGIPGKFSIQSASNTSLYLTFVAPDNSPVFPDAILSNNTSGIPCDNLIWQNTTYNAGVYAGSTDSALQNGSSSITVGGYPQDPPFFLAANVDQTAYVSNNATAQVATWKYNSKNKTFCGSGADANNCLYYDEAPTGARAIRKPLDDPTSPNVNFQWNITPVVSDCTV